MKNCKFAPLIVALIMLASATPLFAQDSWLPAFKEGTSVYLAPTLSPEEIEVFKSSGYAEELKSLGSVNDLQIYVIVTRNAGNKLDEGNKGPALVRRLWENWNNNPSFSESRALVILMTAPKDGPLLTIGVRAGSYLNGLGINRNTMNDPEGPVFTARTQYLSTSPARVPLAIAEKINALVTADTEAKTEAKPEIESATTPETNNTTAVESMNIIAIIGLATLLLVGLIFLSFFSGRKSSKSSSSRSEFENRLRTDRNNKGKFADTDFDSADEAMTASAAAGGILLAEQLRKKPEEPRKTTGNTSSSGNDSATIIPAATSDSSNAAKAGSTCSTTTSNCGGGTSCGGGSSCGGGGCGGGCGS